MQENPQTLNVQSSHLLQEGTNTTVKGFLEVNDYIPTFPRGFMLGTKKVQPSNTLSGLK